MKDWIRQLTESHEDLTDHLDQALTALVEIRDHKRPAPSDPNEVVEPFLHWTQREFLPHLQREQDLFHSVLMNTAQGEALYHSLVSQHDKLRALLVQAREEIMLLLDQDSIREAWWDTLEMSSLWAFRRALSEHIDFEHHEVYPKALGLNVAGSE